MWGWGHSCTVPTLEMLGNLSLKSCILQILYNVMHHWSWLLHLSQGCQEHIGNTRNYKELTTNQANNIQWGLWYKFWDWLRTYCPRTENEKPVEWNCISEGKETFLRQSLDKHPVKLKCFRMTTKVHKSTRTVQLWCAGTIMNDWNKWLDYWLQ